MFSEKIWLRAYKKYKRSLPGNVCREKDSLTGILFGPIYYVEKLILRSEAVLLGEMAFRDSGRKGYHP
mgnify:CR=1 FL=1